MLVLNNFILFCLIFFCLASQIALANEIYRSEDAQGRVTYSDQITTGAKQVEISQRSYRHLHLVKRVYDGDTIILEDNQRVRLLGVNTPEIESRHRQSESGGVAAKEWLQKQLQDKKAYLEFDEEKHDHYKRLLAHIFLSDGKHLNLALVENGLAIVNIIPPNMRYADILINAQQRAEKQSLGVWSIPDYQAYPLSQISSGRKGWQRFIGTPVSIKSSRKYTRLIFTDKVNIRIANENLKLFPKLDNYLNKPLEIRGWISRSKDHYSILIHHPSAIIFQ
ncbi:MAG: thermonuclease family protein [Betaproteobacteria bacterium]|nr:thermonuclease family protein [Betaproteobacteria bacterium]